MPSPVSLRELILLLDISLLSSCGGNNTSPSSHPPGRAESVKTSALESGAKMLQSTSAVKQFDIYLVGFHPMKDNPSKQMEAHHYCKQVNEDFAQCVLFDGNTADANLNGIEYIVSEKLFNTFPMEEKKYWHPHNYEILSGELIGPGLPQAAEKQLMQGKMNSYGKTWHVWMTDDNGKPADKLPMGEPHLAWSFNRDGELLPGSVERRDKRIGTNTTEIRQRRQDLVPLAHPQQGVDDLNGKFPSTTHLIPGVSAIGNGHK